MEISIGILETKGFAAAISAADKILEDSSIEFIKLEKTGGGIISLFFKGEHEILKSAFEKGIREARLIGEIVSVNILAKPNKQIEKLILPIKKSDDISKQTKNLSLENIGIKKSDVMEEKTDVLIKTPIGNSGTVTRKEIRSTKISEGISTIQRLRREALSSVDFTNDKQTITIVREGKNSSNMNLNKIENLNVHELRKLARGTSGFPIQGREISRANRKELVSYFNELG